MKSLLFLTDRYPYNTSEAFIENEIATTSKYFDQIFILPCGLTVDTSTCREVPQNVVVLTPPCNDNLFKTKPSITERLCWVFKHLIPWLLLCIFKKCFYKEILNLYNDNRLSFRRVVKALRTLAPSLRNVYYYRRALNSYDLGDVFVYSYWIEPTILFPEDIVSQGQVLKTFCRTHRWDLYEEENSYNYLAFQKQVIESVDCVYSISDDGANYLKSKYPEYKEKINTSRLGTIDYGMNREKTDRKYRIVSCSNVIPVKRVNLLIDALSMVKNKKDVEWVHFGAGQYFSTIKDYACKKLADVQYTFMGQVSNTTVLEFYKENHVDLFINVSSSEGIPVSIMEAASFGIPIVATNVGGTNEIVKDGHNGYLLDKQFRIENLSEIIDDMIVSDNTPLRNESRVIWSQLYNSEYNYTSFYKNQVLI